jgi:hypothetical protein
MPSGTKKSQYTFRRIVASETISASELATSERLLARFVALAYAAEHPHLFAGGTVEPSGGPTLSCSEVALRDANGSLTELTEYE